MPDLSPPGESQSIHVAKVISVPFQGQDPTCSPSRDVKTEVEFCKVS